MAASKSQPKHRLATPEKMQQPTIKKSRKSAQCAEDIFLNFPVMLVKGLADVLNHCLLDKNSFSFKTLTALKILNCNAADPRQGDSFSHVFCSVEPYRQLYALGDVFIKGLSMLTEFITTRQAPQNDEDKDVLSKLLIFLMELMTREKKTPMKNLDGYNETELAMVLANHLFGKLSTTESFVINERSKFKGKLRGNTECPCEIPTCHLDGQFGNTNVGNSTVWHGHLCILLNNAVVLEPVLTGGFGDDFVDTDTDYTDDSDDDSDDDNPGRQSQVKDCLSRNSKLIAETIVFSFLQKQRCPENDHCLVPCIGVTSREMIIFCYDSQHDILLESSPIPLMSEHPTVLGNINCLAVVVAWLVINYRHMCNGVTADMKTAKSAFFSQANAKLNTYECMLKFGDVGNAYQMEETLSDFYLPNPTSLLEQLNKKVLKLRDET